MRSNLYATPKPKGRPYTPEEQEAAQKIEKLRFEKNRAERSIKDARSHLNQVGRKYRHKPITPEPPFFVRGNTHPDEAEYRRLVMQAERHRAEMGHDEIIKRMHDLDEQDTKKLAAHLGMCSWIDYLADLIKKNDKRMKGRRG